MSKTESFYYPIKPYSTNPLGDAAAQIAQTTGHAPADILAYFAANGNAAVTAWNDPRVSVIALGGGVNGGVGTGRWQWLAVYRVEDAVSQEAELHYAFSQGRNVITVGGSLQAPPPSFANMNLLTSPVLRNIGSTPNAGNGANFVKDILSGTNPSLIITDIPNFLRGEAATGGGWFAYYNDPVIDLTHGGGDWKIRCDAQMGSGAGPLCFVETGGCALSSVGSGLATPPPASFGSLVRINNMWV